MPRGDEEVYVGVVVVKRPTDPLRPQPDPGSWAQAIAHTLTEQGAYYPRGRTAQSAPRAAARAWKRRADWTRPLAFCIGVLCFSCGAYLFYLGLK